MRTRTWLVAALLVSPAAAAGQAAQRQGLPPGPEETIDATGPEEAAGFVRGTVTAVDPAAGRVALDSAGQPVTLNARPDDLAELAPGREVSLPFENYGGHLWVTVGPSSAGQPGPAVPPAAGQGQEPRPVAGRVTALDKNEGRVSIDGTPFLAHPADLEALAPGEAVRLQVRELGGRAWVTRPSTAARRPPAGLP